MAAGLDVGRINVVVRDKLDAPPFLHELRPELKQVFGTAGPLWYRGHFPGPDGATAAQAAELDAARAAYGVRAVVVGHTTRPAVQVLHGGRLLALDAGMRSGAGEGLIFEGGRLFRATAAGAREPLESDE